jgi:hypothetical protein
MDLQVLILHSNAQLWQVILPEIGTQQRLHYLLSNVSFIIDNLFRNWVFNLNTRIHFHSRNYCVCLPKLTVPAPSVFDIPAAFTAATLPFFDVIYQYK